MAGRLTRLSDFVLSPTAEPGWLLVEERWIRRESARLSRSSLLATDISA